MGRLGITYPDVVNAAEQLVAQGKNPTVESVRFIIGSGSSGTIAPFLRTWKSKLNESQQYALKEKIPEELIAALKGLWEKVYAEAYEQFEQQKEKYQHDWNDLNKNFSQLQIEYNISQQKIHALDQEIIKANNHINSLDQTILQLKEEKSTLTHIQDKLTKESNIQEIRIKELHTLHQQVQNNLEHYREESLLQRRQEQQAHEAECLQFEESIRFLQNELRQSQLKNADTQQKFLSEHNEKNSLSEQVRDLKNEMTISIQKCNDLEIKLFNQNQLNEHLQKQYDILHELHLHDSKKAQDASSQLAHATQTLHVTEEMLKNLTNQYHVLIKDKWILEQERNTYYAKKEKELTD